ncbi:kinase-like domain-containing protein, partial [Cunninghamella echinulata]
VFLVRSNINHELYALKSIVKELVIEQREITHSLTEREILATLADIRHPNLAKLYLAFQDTYRLYLVTDYYCGGDLATQMSTCMTFSKERTRFYAAEMIEGIGELHRLGILYRDLKPENILLTKQGHVVLTDFGLSKWLVKTDYTETFCGTAEYLAPEVLTGDPYSFGIDHWSYGTILFEMLAGITPFWADNHMEMYRRVLEDPLEFPLPDENGLPEFDYETVDFLTAILDRNPATRLGAGGVQEIKSHAYFAGISWDDVYHQKLQPPYVPILSSQTDFSNFDATFLDMPTILTPMGSQVNLTHDMQDVFEGYAYNDDRFLPKMKSFIKLDSIQQVDDEDEEVEREQQQQQLQREEKETEDHMVHQQQRIVEINMMTDDMIIDEVDTTDNHHYNVNNSEQISTPSPHQTSYDTDIIVIQNDGEKQKISPTFQPARKRGSISLLSEVGSFQLDSPLIHNDHDRTVKRRNTHDDILLTSPPPSKPLLVDASSSTTTTMDDHMDDSLHTSSYVPDTQFLSKDPYDPHLLFDQHHHHLQQQPQHQQELQTESDIQLDFEGPDLDLRFSLEVDQNQHGFSSNPTKIPTKPKKRKYSTRRLLSPFIRF